MPLPLLEDGEPVEAGKRVAGPWSESKGYRVPEEPVAPSSHGRYGSVA